MPISQQEQAFVSHLLDLMQSLGPVSAKSMFGGHGIFHNGIMFGLVANSILYLKVDVETKKDFKAKELGPFTYSRKGKEFAMSYYQAPEEALEDVEEMNLWAKKAYGAAARESRKKKAKKKP